MNMTMTIVTMMIWLMRTVTVIIMCKRILLDEIITMIVTKIKTYFAQEVKVILKPKSEDRDKDQ